MFKMTGKRTQLGGGGEIEHKDTFYMTCLIYLRKLRKNKTDFIRMNGDFVPHEVKLKC